MTGPAGDGPVPATAPAGDGPAPMTGPAGDGLPPMTGSPTAAKPAGVPTRGRLHHVELWVPDLAGAVAAWAPLLSALGYTRHQSWQHGVSYRLDATYLVLEQSPALSAGSHDRTRPGLNHLAFWAGSPEQVDALTDTAQRHGWSLLFPDRHPHAGGPDQYAAYLADPAGYEIELVADPR